LEAKAVMSLSTPDAKSSRPDNVLEFATLVKALAQQQKLRESQVRALLRQLFSLTTDGLKKGKLVRIRGLGTLRIREPVAGAATRQGRPVPRRVVLIAEKALKAALGL
jgi:nucleoid DNA-binding protein